MFTRRQDCGFSKIMKILCGWWMDCGLWTVDEIVVDGFVVVCGLENSHYFTGDILRALTPLFLKNFPPV